MKDADTRSDQPAPTITTKAWQRAGYPFELWLRYAAADEETQRKVQVAFWQDHPGLKEN